MSNADMCKSAKHDSLFMICITSHGTNFYIAKIMRNNIIDINIIRLLAVFFILINQQLCKFII